MYFSFFLITAKRRSLDVIGIWNKKWPLYHGFWFRILGISRKPHTMALAQPMAGEQLGSERQLLDASGCFLLLPSSQSNHRVQTLKCLSSLHPYWCFGWVRSVIFESDVLILAARPVSVSSTAVWGCGFLTEEKKLEDAEEHISCTSTL